MTCAKSSLQNGRSDVSTPVRARLLAALSLIGETSHADAIRNLIASDDQAPWGGWQSFPQPTGIRAPADDTSPLRLGIRDIRSTAAETPARWVGGLLAIRALRSQKSELLPELRRIVEECDDPVVVCNGADELVAVSRGEEDYRRAESSLRLAHERLSRSTPGGDDSIAKAIALLEVELR